MLEGYVHPNFRPVLRVLRRQLPKQHGGIAAAIYYKGNCVVDVWGGTMDLQQTPWQKDTMAVSFSTTKGVASTLLHVLANQGLIDYDEPVAKYWPEFTGGGKENITVRHLMSHQGGMYHIRDMVQHASQMLDWEFMVKAIENSVPMHKPGEYNGYHALTYGWLVGELIQKVAKDSFANVLKRELCNPLELDGMFVGVPEAELSRCAKLISIKKRDNNPNKNPKEHRSKSLEKFMWKVSSKVLKFDLEYVRKAFLPRGISSLDFSSPEVLQSCIPSASGVFTARSLAKMYSVLANGGERDGIHLFSKDTFMNATQIQSKKRGRIMPVSMHWRLGYHRVFTLLGNKSPRGFGHAGYGGSGAWACPDRDLAVAMVLNSGVGTPFGDLRLVQLNTVAIDCADRCKSVVVK